LSICFRYVEVVKGLLCSAIVLAGLPEAFTVYMLAIDEDRVVRVYSERHSTIILAMLAADQDHLTV
jgi:hypothetical protein